MDQGPDTDTDLSGDSFVDPVDVDANDQATLRGQARNQARDHRPQIEMVTRSPRAD